MILLAVLPWLLAAGIIAEILAGLAVLIAAALRARRGDV